MHDEGPTSTTPPGAVVEGDGGEDDPRAPSVMVEFLLESGSLLSRSLDVRGVLQGLAELCTPRLCELVRGRPPRRGRGRRAGRLRARGRGAAARSAAELAARLPPAAGASRGVAGVLASGQPEVTAPPCDPLLLAAALGAARADVVERLGAAA